MHIRRIALFTGPLLFMLLAYLPAPSGLSYPAQMTAAITAWIALWWITEPVNSAVTSLLPLVLFPMCGVLPLKNISAEYGNEIIFLFIAGFFLGKAIEKWELHRRMALTMVSWLGTDPSRMVLGFMVATAGISMWISNTATAVMMTPVALAVSANVAHSDSHGANFNKALMLGVGYACSIGGLATMIGTPTNAIFLSFAQAKFGETVSFWKWFLLGFPFATTLLLLCWQLLVRMFPLSLNREARLHSKDTIVAELKALGPVTSAEKRLMIVFGLVIIAWVSGSLLWYRWWPNCNDTIVAVGGALLLFVIPAKRRDSDTVSETAVAVPLLDWETAIKIPWGVVLLFGGGLALAKGFDASGLAGWIGEQLKSLNSLPHAVILLIVLVVVVALSEVASNIATASMMMPVLAALSASIGAHPFGLCMSATMAASFGFGLPVATAPNSIVYASGYLNTRDMAKAGFVLDVISIFLLLLFMYALLPLVWGITV